MPAEVSTVQKLANATATGMGCFGHKKADRNDELVKRYTQELKDAGEAVPSRDELLKMGVFNGPGSS